MAKRNCQGCTNPDPAHRVWRAHLRTPAPGTLNLKSEFDAKIEYVAAGSPPPTQNINTN